MTRNRLVPALQHQQRAGHQRQRRQDRQPSHRSLLSRPHTLRRATAMPPLPIERRCSVLRSGQPSKAHSGRRPPAAGRRHGPVAKRGGISPAGPHRPRPRADAAGASRHGAARCTRISRPETNRCYRQIIAAWSAPARARHSSLADDKPQLAIFRQAVKGVRNSLVAALDAVGVDVHRPCECSVRHPCSHPLRVETVHRRTWSQGPVTQEGRY